LAKSNILLRETETKLREEYQQAILKQNREVAEREASLTQTILDLRNSVSKIGERSSWKEEEYNNEIQDLKARLRAAESRNEELASAVPEATQPLLRQIESLQAINSERLKIFEELERNFTIRLHDSETQLQQAIENEQSITDKYNELVYKVKSMESQLSIQKGAYSRLAAEVEFERIRADEKQKELDQLQAQLTGLTLLHERSTQEARQTELKLQRMIAETQQREELFKKEKQEFEEKSRKFYEESKEAFKVQSVVQVSRSNKFESFDPQNSFPMEKIQGLLRQKEGEVSSLQQQISHLEKTRDLLQDELVNLTSKNELITTELKELKEIKNQMKDVTQRYTTALDLIGEKEEQVEELKADIDDVKILYKTQISELLEQIEKLKKSKTNF